MVVSITPFKGPRHNLLVAEPPSPAAGASLIWAVPDKRIVEITSVTVLLSNDAPGTDRFLYIDGMTSTGVLFGRSGATCVQAPSLDFLYHFAIGARELANLAFEDVYCRLTDGLQLDSDESLKIAVFDMEAGDQLSDCVIRYYAWQQG